METAKNIKYKLPRNCTSILKVYLRGEESRILRCTVTFHFVQGNQPFLNAELQNYFEIAEESLAEITDGDKLVVPRGLLCQFASFGYGSFRGILYLKSINTPYSDIIMPPLYVHEIIKEDLEIDLVKQA